MPPKTNDRNNSSTYNTVSARKARREPILVCKASPEGVLVIDRGHNVFYPKVLKGKLPAKQFTEDERFLHYCFSGIKRVNPDELRRMTPDHIQYIEQLNKRAMSVIVRLKEQIAHDWSVGILKPWLCYGKNYRSTITQLVIDDIREIQLPIDIPRPILINELLKLKEV